jgi:hypothetical protein
MSFGRFALSVAMIYAVPVCGLVHAAAPANSAPRAVAQATTKEPAGEGIACASDKDCPVMACGPCTPGTPITKAMFPSPSCAVNPCLDASAICNNERRCEIGPRTRKNPAVWKQPSR